MKRTLKFRVWDKLEKRYLQITPLSKQHYMLDLEGKFYNLQNGSGGDEYVVEQFTGKQYGDWKDLYEGDIINFYDNKNKINVGIIVYSEYYAGFGIKYVDDGYDAVESLTDPFLCFASVEVIGNINENPELLDMKN